MAYRFKLDESPETGLRRIAAEQATRIVMRLSSGGEAEATVHESRKSLKRLKALFKLVRGGLEVKAYKHEYGVIRDVGRALSGVRDLEVMPSTLAALRATDEAVEADAAEQVRKAIVQAYRKVAASGGRPDILAAAAEQMKSACVRYKKLKLGRQDFNLLAAGTGAGLRALRRQHTTALESGADEDYHDWRKSVQLHWRHLRLLDEVWPAFMSARINITKGLAQALGDDHDLSVLANFVSELPPSRLKASRRKTLLDAIRRRQLQLREQALAYAGPLVIDSPKGFAGRLCAFHAARLAAARLPAMPVDLFAAPPAE